MNIVEFTKKFADQFEDLEDTNMQSGTQFRNLKTWDSLTAMCVQTMILDDYQVTLTDQELKKLTTIQDVYDFVVNAKK